MPPAILAPHASTPAPSFLPSLPTAVRTAASASLITLSVLVPTLALLALALACIYLRHFRDRRTLPSPAPVASPDCLKSPRRRDTFVSPPAGDSSPGAKLDTFAVHSRDAATPCALCTTPLGGGMVTAARCGHVIHTACLEKWLGGRGAVCPVCARDLRPTRSLNQLQAPAESGDEGGDDAAHWGVAEDDAAHRGVAEDDGAHWGVAKADAGGESDGDAGGDLGNDVVDPLAQAYVRTNSEVALTAQIPRSASVWAAPTTDADAARFAKSKSACAGALPRSGTTVHFADADVRRILDAARGGTLGEPLGAASVEGGDVDEEVESESEEDGFSDGWSEANGCVVREYVDEDEFGEGGLFSVVVRG